VLGCEQRVAYEVLRITLHTVRDRLSVDDNAKVGNDLPLLLRSLYFEAWDPMKTHGHDDLRDLATSLLAALPLTAASDRDAFAKILTLFEPRSRCACAPRDAARRPTSGRRRRPWRTGRPSPASNNGRDASVGVRHSFGLHNILSFKQIQRFCLHGSRVEQSSGGHPKVRSFT
jgi:hypothetical protein